jgi:hypothetical protein
MKEAVGQLLALVNGAGAARALAATVPSPSAKQMRGEVARRRETELSFK